MPDEAQESLAFHELNLWLDRNGFGNYHAVVILHDCKAQIDTTLVYTVGSECQLTKDQKRHVIAQGIECVETSETTTARIRGS